MWAEINFGGAREFYLREIESANQTTKMKTKKKSSVQKFPQIQVVVKKGLRPKGFIISGVNPQKLRKNSFRSQILGR